MEFLTVKKLCKVYGRDESQVTALDHVSLTIEKGEFTAIIGSSGSGNPLCSTALREWISRREERFIWTGRISMPRTMKKLAIFRRRQVGLIYQFHNLIPTLNVVENITLPILMDRRKVNKERLNDLLDLLGLKDRKTICRTSFPADSSRGWRSGGR